MGEVASARWADMLDEVDRQRHEIGRVARSLAELTARATSPDRLVSVTVDARGSLIGLEIEQPALRRYRATQLCEVITGLVADADASLRGRRTELLTAASAPAPAYADLDESAR